MEAVRTVVKWLLDAGAPVMMPIVITVFGLVMRQGFGRSFKAGLMTGMGLIGISTIVSLITGSMGPAAKAMVDNLHLQFKALDIGGLAAMTWAVPTSMFIIPLILVVNLIMLALNLTKTFHIDIWNYWHFAFAAAVPYLLTQNVPLSLAIAVLTAYVTYKLADWAYPACADPQTFNIPGITLAHSGTIAWAPYVYAINKVLDKIPGVRDWKATPEDLAKRFGVFGEPSVIGLIMGIVIGALARYNLQGILKLGVTMAAGLIIMPRVISLIVEGLIPLADGIRDYVTQRFPGREIYIGMDAALIVGHPTTLAVSYFLVPITLLLAIILPGNGTLPYSMLASIFFPICWAVAPSKGNVVRTLIGGLFIMAVILYGTTIVAEYAHEGFKLIGAKLPEGMLATDMLAGRQFFPWVLVLIMQPLVGKGAMWQLLVGIFILATYFLIWWWVRDEPARCAAIDMEAEK
ncbi:MAG: PTS galactitol transporter subunit IIC [Chloroflexi bacterium]|nr:PTS galactitol transporter subunit IIC [Chloroflexota bacterium]